MSCSFFFFFSFGSFSFAYSRQCNCYTWKALYLHLKHLWFQKAIWHICYAQRITVLSRNAFKTLLLLFPASKDWQPTYKIVNTHPHLNSVKIPFYKQTEQINRTCHGPQNGQRIHSRHQVLVSRFHGGVVQHTHSRWNSSLWNGPYLHSWSCYSPWRIYQTLSSTAPIQLCRPLARKEVVIILFSVPTVEHTQNQAYSRTAVTYKWANSS